MSGLWPRASTEPVEARPVAEPALPSDARAALAVGWRRHRRWAAVVALVLAVTALLSWGGPPPRSSAAYHPANPTFNGAQALARVLDAQGVRVVVATGESALRAAAIDADTTVLLTSGADLREPTLTALKGLAGPAERLVLVRPERRVVRALAPAVAVREVPRQGSALVSAVGGTDVHAGEALSRSQAEYQDTRAAATFFVTDGYAVHLTTTAPGLREVVLVGSTDVVTNDRIGQADNAAIILRTLGHSSRVVWYVPDLRDVPPSAAQQSESFTPPWWGSMILLLGFTTLALIWWRARRFGRLVVEPLPVVVRAVETTESRARLYRRARDGQRASAVLREATCRRLAAYLGMPPGTRPETIAEATAAATGRPLGEVGWLLAGPPVHSEDDMLGLAAMLATLEKEIRRS